jgi:hypothetical protein
MMKQIALLLILLSTLCTGFSQGQPEQEKLNLPGDNFNLYAALKLFQESETLEGFEKSLNDESTNINNLDLNGDNKIDYIKVVDNVDGDTHNIALKVSVDQNEDQDVAVFVVQKKADGQVEVQLIGDEDLYGKDYIIEPNYETADNSAGTPNPGYVPPTPELNREIVVQSTTPAQVTTWSVIRFIFVPSYVVWRSPWHWAYYPGYWRPWKPNYWHYYYGYHYHWDYYYYGHYRRWNYYRYPSWRTYYYRPGFRSHSVFVQTRFTRGDFKKTYSRPDMAKNGAAVFKRDFPKAPSVNDRLPSFDKTGKPIHQKPAIQPAIKPGVTRPITTQPVTKPVITHPITKPAITRPVTRPVITNPVTKPITEKPVTRPVTRPIIEKPVTRPVTRPHITQPVTKPVTRPQTTQPVTRPVNKPINKPSLPGNQVRPIPTRPLPDKKDAR